MDDNKINPTDLQTPESQEKPNPVVEEVSPEVITPGQEEVVAVGTPPSPPPAYEENRSKYVIIAGVVLFFLIVFLVILRVIFRGTSAPAPVKLTYWGLWEDKEVFAPLIDQYQRKFTHVKIDYQKMVPQEYRKKLIARSKNGQGPDLFRFHNTWVPELTDVLAPLPESVMSTSEFEKTFYKIHQSDLKVGKYFFGIPLMIDGLVLIYNDTLLKRAGIETSPKTWDDLTDAVIQLTVKDSSGQLITSGIALGTASNIVHFSDILGLMLVQNGASLTSLDKPEAEGALESFRKFAEPPSNFWDETMPDSINAFIQEKVAIIFAPSWQVITIKSVNPDIKLKVVSVPTVPGSKPVSIANYWVEGVSKMSKNQVEAWKFLRFLSEKDTLTKLYENESKMKLFGEPYSRVDLASVIIQDEYVGAVVSQADTYVSLPLIARTYDEGLNDEIIQYLENAINATSKGVTYGVALKTAKQGVDQVFSKYNIRVK